MSATSKITELCETWWQRMSDSSSAGQHQFAEEFLRLLGWRDLVPVENSIRLSRGTAATYVLGGNNCSAVAAHFVMPGVLTPPGAMQERGLDFCEAARTLVNAASRLSLRYTFITDFYRSYLYDVSTDELLLCADTPLEFEREFGGVLFRSDVTQGALDELRREPRSCVARQLRTWCKRWTDELVAQWHLPQETAALAMDRLVLVRYLFDHNVLKRPGWRMHKRFSEVLTRAFTDAGAGSGSMLIALCHELGSGWRADFFTPNAVLDGVLGHDAVAAPLLREFALLSRTKFDMAVVLESFNYGDASEKARVRMVPEDDEERAAYLGRQTLQTLDSVRVEVDIREEGYRAIFHWFDRLLALFDHFDAEFEATSDAPAASAEGMDLFAWSEHNAKRPGALADKFEHIVERGLTLYYANERQLRTSRMLLYMHLINTFEQRKHRFSRFPRVEMALKARPAVLESDRKWMYESAPEQAEEEWGVV